VKDCLTLSEFERYARGEMARSDAARFDDHIAACDRCEAAYQSFLKDNRFLDGVKNALDPSGFEETQSSAYRAAHEPDETTAHVPQQASSGFRTRASRPERFPQIEGYEIKRIVGRGGMGVVYEAIQEKLHRPVALKLLPAVVSSAHPEFVARFQREATAAARLHHTNIIPVYDFGESSDGYYYAMELIDGQPLNVVIKRLAAIDAPIASPTSFATLLTTPQLVADGKAVSNLPPEEPPSTSSSSTGSKGRTYYRQVARWIADVAQALHYAHVRGMVHRDIKPGNLMLCTDGRIMVLDFGLVKTVGDQSVTATGSLVGTYRYMSPEQVGAKRISVDARSDVYSLAATLYELLTFQPAFVTADQSELFSQILFKEPIPPRKIVSSVPIDLQTICLKALEKSPTERYQTAKALADDLNLYLQDQAIVARRQGPLRRAIKLVRRRRVETAALAAFILLIAATMFGLRSHTREQESREEAQLAVRFELIKEAIARWQKHDWQAAEQAFEKVLSANPDDYAALVNLASMYKDQYYAHKDEGFLDKAAELLDHAIEVSPERLDAYNAKGVLYQAWDRPSDAFDVYRKVCALDENYYPVWVNLGMLHATEGNLAEAEKCAKKGVELARAEHGDVSDVAGASRTVMPLRVLAAIQVQLGRSGALETLVAAKSRSRNQDAAILVLTAKYYLEGGGEENTQKALDLAVSANSLVESGVFDEPDTVEESETLPRAKRMLAVARLRNAQWRAAIQAAGEAMGAGDQATFSQLILAIANGRLGDMAAAQAHLRAAEATWPDKLKQSGFIAIQDGRSLWFDTAEELKTLHEEARRLIEESSDPS